MNIINELVDRMKGKAEKGQKRSKWWRKVRATHIRNNPTCYVCGSKKKVEVHHKIPFNIAPDLELKVDNLVSLCENKKYGINCHLLIGHLGNYRRINAQIDYDTRTWRMKLGKVE